MIRTMKMLSLIGLAFILIPTLFYFLETVELPVVKSMALVGTAIWFLATPAWLKN